ncbi:MAG TPA: hypothetical protein DHV08_06050 [Rhodocyclaceae bacterium]|nr:MAG: hypothetical protein AUK49_05725 [Betaproteobacteria bacterium CG2_30_68_42]PIV72041.1 MAG: hypothetical protein COW56_11410 [Rhodocyclales bacterium CG17_big_fil_post_rev_8_21_14_2_50_68_7]PIX74374.1 MAG: hypothetical protein COZ38_10700 [Rhodocyclales bacterium CG_4_10_14_3_um_filter_68_10]PJA56495.1 MAG: hypothetical protein CO164_12825 [Rhodocyclales bacterium CG_4_9_14_3_um_filter_68_10]HCX33147.1 hypothetical protein [Rhodocyclaceae bacterium]
MKVVALETRLFPDAPAVGAALDALAAEHAVVRIECARAGMGEEDWDRLLAEILASDLVVTL